jgi:hypothetical protein
MFTKFRGIFLIELAHSACSSGIIWGSNKVLIWKWINFPNLSAVGVYLIILY